MIDRIKNEPALVATLVNAVLLCVAAFGLHLSAEQIAGVMAVTNAVLAVVVRQSVTPTRNAQSE